MSLKIGILGGTFDPIHEGHLALAAHALGQFHLDKVFFIPAAVSPFKVQQPAGASAGDRLAMTRLAVEGNPCFEVSALEIDRGGVSYTVDTLRDFYGKFPGAELFLLMGEDTFEGVGRWKEYGTVLKLAKLVVAPRCADSPKKEHAQAHWLRMPLCDASSTEVRIGLVQSNPEALSRIPLAVREYILSREIYRGVKK